MSHEWDRGVLHQSSWHGLEEVGVYTTADELITAGERTGAWPVAVQLRPLQVQGFECEQPEERAVVASYAEHRARCVGVVGSRYTATTPESWRSLVHAADKAGAKPTGAFSLRGGRLVIGTFQVNGADDGIVTNLLLADSFDGSTKLCVGTTSVRVVCANTLAAAMRSDGAGMAQLRHTASLEEQVAVLAGQIGQALKAGERMRDLYKAARDMRLDKVTAQAAFDALFPEAPKDSAQGIITRAEGARQEARLASVLPVNSEGSTLATLWNAATYLVDRKADGASRSTRGGDSLDSMLFGARGARVSEIQATVETILQGVRDMPIAARVLADAGVN